MSAKARVAVRTRSVTQGIFCLEGDWWGDLRQSSTVKPVLKLLSQGASYAVPYIHRDVGTVEELQYYLAKWRQIGMRRYPVLYLALHGTAGHVCVGDMRRTGANVPLDQLAEWLGSSLAGRHIHFGSCETLLTDKRNLRRFTTRTQVTAISGYRESVDWLRAAAFEVLLFEVLTRKRIAVMQARSARNEINREFKPLAREHDFRMFVRGD